MTGLILVERIERKILIIRGHKVMLDSDLAAMYGVGVKTLNQAVRRNSKRFPSDFMFQFTAQEYESLRSQFVTLEAGRGKYRKYLPYAFTEHGVAMLSSVLRSERAVQVNISIMRVFGRLRRLLDTHKVLGRELADLEKKYDSHFRIVFEAIRELMEPVPGRGRRKIGF
jgi:aromatic ring-opening dioxygenase LigB subunit